jgi:hypothetical protein
MAWLTTRENTKEKSIYAFDQMFVVAAFLGHLCDVSLCTLNAMVLNATLLEKQVLSQTFKWFFGCPHRRTL